VNEFTGVPEFRTFLQTYDELLEEARLCLRTAAEVANPAIAEQLTRMARELQKRAAKLYMGDLPDKSPDILPRSRS
jgi:hypothetical protein